MHARILASASSFFLAAGCGAALVLAGCSSEDATADGASVESSSNATPSSTATGEDAPSAKDASRAAAQPSAKPSSSKEGAVDSGAKPMSDAERKQRELAEAEAHRRRDGAKVDAGKIKQQIMELEQMHRRGEIDERAYAEKRRALEMELRGGTTGPKEVDPEGAQLVFAEKEHDFGTVWDTQELKCEFVFRNEGGKTLEITNIKPSCGCTTHSLDQTSFEPGMGELIPVVWKPKGEGPQKKTVTVSHANGPDQVLNVSANIKAFAKLEPKLLRVGDLPQHEEHHFEMKVVPLGHEYEITRLQAFSPHLAVSEQGRDADGNILLDVVIEDSAPWGNFNARFEVEGTGLTEPGGDPVTHEISTQVIAKMFGDIRMEPEQIQLGIVPAGSDFEGETILYHVDGEPFELEELEMRFSRPPMEARWEPTTHLGKPAVKIVLSGTTAGSAEKYVRGTAFFRTNLGDADVQQLQIAGSVR